MKNNTLNFEPKDWESTKKVAHQIIDDIFELYQNLDKSKCWKPLPDNLKKNDIELPNEEKTFDEVYEEVKSTILPYYQGNLHPGYFAWIQGGGNITSTLADLLASSINSNSSIGDHAARYIEKQVINWNKELFQLSEDSTGILLTGSSIANLNAIITAVNWKSKLNTDKDKFTLYCSKETHNCIAKAVKIVGLKKVAIKYIPVNEKFEICIEKLEQTIKEDIITGNIPFLIIANLGTVNTGAIDPIREMSNLAEFYNMWFHIDGAYGLPACLCQEFSSIKNILFKADSIAFDYHKLFNINYDVGCLMVKNRSYLEDSFSTHEVPHYLINGKEGIAGGISSTDSLGPELSRSFRSLKIWMFFKQFGVKKISEVIENKILQTKYLEELVVENPYLELVTPASLGIVTFRFIKHGMNKIQLDDLNRNIVVTTQYKGNFVPSLTKINDRVVIRICITNHRTNNEHILNLINELCSIGINL